MKAAARSLSVAIRFVRRECTGRDPARMTQLDRILGRQRIAPRRRTPAVPAIIAGAGEHAAQRFREFFTARRAGPGRQPNRAAYYRATRSFFTWLKRSGITELAAVNPPDIARYLQAVKRSAIDAVTGRPATEAIVRQHMTAIRTLFDWLVAGHILAVNPAIATSSPKRMIKDNKTALLTARQVRQFLRGSRVPKQQSSSVLNNTV